MNQVPNINKNQHKKHIVRIIGCSFNIHICKLKPDSRKSFFNRDIHFRNDSYLCDDSAWNFRFIFAFAFRPVQIHVECTSPASYC